MCSRPAGSCSADGRYSPRAGPRDSSAAVGCCGEQRWASWGAAPRSWLRSWRRSWRRSWWWAHVICCTKWLGSVPVLLTNCSSLQQSYKQAGKVTPPSDANPDRLLVRCEMDGRRCLTTASHWANSCCGQQGWQPSDLRVGQPKKRAGMKQMLRLLQRHELAGCRPPLYNVLPARVLADPVTLDTVGCWGLYWVAWVPVALGWQTNDD